MAPLNEDPPPISSTNIDRVHKTFLFTDIVQSTNIRAAVIREFGDAGNQKYDNEVLVRHDEILNRIIAGFNGVVVSTAGDSYFVAFDGAQSAIQCAVTIQAELIQARIPLPVYEPDLPPYLQIRIGLHTGGARELLRAGKVNYSDHTINIASRIEGFADAEQVLMSEESWASGGRLNGITKHEWEGYELKGVDGTWTLVEALWDGRAPRAPRAQTQLNIDSDRSIAPFILPQLDISTFAGRAEELSRLESLLLQRDGATVSSIVGLAGGGGIGKSALACHFAALHRDAFPDGVLGLRVDGKTNDTIAREFARLCGEEIALDDERQPATIMQEVFAHRRMLLVFDNAIDPAIQELRPGGQTCAVIVTTRDRQLPFLLDISDERRIDLSPLPLVDARFLLEQLIGEQRVAAEPEAIEEIIKLIGSLPLALQIVGSTLHLQQDSNIADYAASLRTERERLEMLKVRGASHMDVLASFSLSLRLLTDDEIAFFACQSVCAPDGFSLQTAMAAGGCDEAKARERLNYLYRLSLLNRPGMGVGRYLFHALIRLFAQNLLIERSLQSAAAERHARYLIQLVKTSEIADPGTAELVVEDTGDYTLAAEWLRQQQVLDQEFVISFEHFLEQHAYWKQAAMLMRDFLPLAERQEDWPLVGRFLLKQARYLSLLGDAEEAEDTLILASEIISRVEDAESQQRFKAIWFNTLGGVWQRQGRYDGAAEAFKCSAAIDEQRDDRIRLSAVLNRLGSVLKQQGHFDEAADVLQRSYVIAEQLGDRRVIAMVLTSLGGVLQRQGDFKAAAHAFQRSAEIEEELQNRSGQAMVLNSLGVVLQHQGHFDEAVDTFKRDIAISEQLEDKRSLAMVLNSLGGVLQRMGSFDEAVNNLRRSYTIFAQLGDQRSLRMVLNSLGGVLQRQGRFNEALDAFQRSLASAQQMDDQRSIALVLNSLGGVLQRLGRFGEAVDALRRSIAISEKLEDKRSLAMVLNSLGGVLQRQGAFDDAIDAFRRSMTISEQLGDQQSLAMVLNSSGGMLRRQGRFDEAASELQRSANLGESLGDARHLSMVLNSLGSVLVKQGRLDEAAETLERSVEIGETLGDARHLSMVLNSLGRVLQRQGRFDEAGKVLERSYTISEELGDRRGLAIVLNSFGSLLQGQRRFDEAVDVFRRSMKIFDELGDQHGLAVVLNSVGGLLQRQGRFSEALDAFRRSYLVHEGLDDRLTLAKIHLGLGKAYFSLRDFTEALSPLRRCFEINESLRIRHGLVAVTPLLTEVLAKLGRIDEAQGYCRRALAVAPDEARLNALSETLAAPVAQTVALPIQQGKIKFMKLHERGYRYGFIIPDDAAGDIYFQERDVHPSARPDIKNGTRVEFEVLAVAKGRQAKKVRII